MSSYIQKKHHEFMLRVKTRAPELTDDNVLSDLWYILSFFKERVKNAQIKELLPVRSTDDAILDMYVYIKLDEKKMPVSRDYWTKESCLGYKAFAT